MNRRYFKTFSMTVPCLYSFCCGRGGTISSSSRSWPWPLTNYLPTPPINSNSTPPHPRQGIKHPPPPSLIINFIIILRPLLLRHRHPPRSSRYCRRTPNSAAAAAHSIFFATATPPTATTVSPPVRYYTPPLSSSLTTSFSRRFLYWDTNSSQKHPPPAASQSENSNRSSSSLSSDDIQKQSNLRSSSNTNIMNRSFISPIGQTTTITAKILQTMNGTLLLCQCTEIHRWRHAGTTSTFLSGTCTHTHGVMDI